MQKQIDVDEMTLLLTQHTVSFSFVRTRLFKIQFQGGNGRGSQTIVECFTSLKILFSSLPIHYSAYNVLLIMSVSTCNFVLTFWMNLGMGRMVRVLFMLRISYYIFCSLNVHTKHLTIYILEIKFY